MNKLIGESFPHLPWQDRPKNSAEPVWRFTGNPIIGRNPRPGIAMVYNGAIVPWRDGFIGVFRADYASHMPALHVGHSADGIAWKIEAKAIELAACAPDRQPLEFAYDPRVCRIDDTYYVTWCNGYHGPTIGLARTKDFKTFEQLENVFLPANRNGVLFPRTFDGRYRILSRPSDRGHTPFGEIYSSESPDLCHWGRHHYVMGPGKKWWECVKVGAGPTPIETTGGWLLFYHGVMSTCNGYVYSMGAALLDRDEPWRVSARTDEPLLGPESDYEVQGKVPNIVFPCAVLADAPTGRMAIYYGAADTVTALAFTRIEWVMDRLQ